MASTYSSNLKIELIATGEQSGTWGITTNTNLGTALEEAIVGYGNPDFASDADLTLTLTDANSAQTARNFVLNVTSSVSLTATRNLVVPTIEKPYVVINATTGSQSIVVKTSAGTGITVPNGSTMFLYADGTNVVNAINNLPSGATVGGVAISTSTGDVTGPASSTDNAFTRFDSTTGKLIQNSTGATLDDTGAPTFTGSVNVAGTAAAAADMKLYEDTDNGTNYIGLQAPASVATSTTFVLPDADGSSGQILQTDGAGNLSFVTNSGITTGKAIAMSIVFG
jgi:hypothetical protein